MNSTVKVAISLPSDLFHEAERERGLRGRSRSAFFRDAIENYLLATKEAALDEEYVKAYRRQPETEAEIASNLALAVASLASEPWD